MEIEKKTQEETVEHINLIIQTHKDQEGFSAKGISDGYHTFQELYKFRMMYNAALFNEWGSLEGYGGEAIVLHDVHKSWKHNDGEWCFGEEKEWFIVSAMLPSGLISNHYKAEHWDLFKVPEVGKAKYEFDGHTGKDVLIRLRNLIQPEL